MKKIVSIFIVLFSISSLAQNTKNKLYLHSANTGFGIFLFDLNAEDGGGVSFFANMTTGIHKNLFGISYFTGSDIPILGGSQYNMHELSLSYGREVKPFDWFAIQGFAGVGVYTQNSEYEEVLEGNTFSYPLKINLKFWFNQRFGMGISSIYNINSINDFYSINLMFTISLE